MNAMDVKNSIVPRSHLIYSCREYVSLSGSVDLVQRDKVAVSFFFFFFDQRVIWAS